MSPRTIRKALADLRMEDLRKAVFDRLHGRPSIGPPLDSRGDTSPHDWLVEEYRSGSADLCRRMETIARDFVKELTDGERWPEESRILLLDFVQDAPIPTNALDGVLDGFIRNRTILKRFGKEAHASLLKCVLNSGNKYSPEFWLGQLKTLGADYGALVFGGLLEHGLPVAAAHLKACCASEDAVANMALLIPVLVDDHGCEAVEKEIGSRLRELPRAAREELADALRDEGCKIEEPVAGSKKRVSAQYAKVLWTESSKGNGSATFPKWREAAPSRPISESLFCHA